MAIDAFVASEETQSRVLDALKDRNVSRLQGQINDGGFPAAVQYYSDVPTPDVLIVEFEASGEELMAGLKSLADVCDPGTRVIVIGEENDVGLYRSLIKMGISDYLVAPVTSGQIFDALYALVADPDALPSGKVFAFMGAHGGVGSSTLAHNVAWSLAEVRDLDVALLDLDLQFGTAALSFNVEARQGIYDCLSQPDRLDEQLLDRFMVPYEEHLRILGTSGSLNLPERLDSEALDQLVTIVARRFPFVVLDVPPRWNDWVRATITSADDVMVTATPDLVSLRDAQNLLRHINEVRGDERRAKLVINQIGKTKKTELNERDFEDAIGDKPTLTVAYDAILFGTASNNGQPVGEVSGRSKAAGNFRQLAETLSGSQKSGKSRKKGLISLLSRG
tara:strand:+ start:4582 stop:5757 length:1176 start_codon:yes stop_codon:yes gene_type:complete